MPNRLNPIAQYLMVLAVTVAAYGLYAKFAVPIFQGPAVAIPNSIPDGQVYPRAFTSKEGFEKLFPPGAWELGPCKTMETKHGKVLFKDYLPTDDGKIKVFPFSIILNSKQADEPPMVLRCEDSAKLHLDRPLTLGKSESKTNRFNSKPGGNKMERAELLGTVEIYRPPSTENGTDGIAIETSNVHIEKEQIFTRTHVRFRFGVNYGSGSNLRIDLAQTTPGNPLTSDFSKIQGIKRIELGTVDEMVFTPPTRPPSATGLAAADDRILSVRSTPIRVSCDGNFVFDLQKQTASFAEQVVVQQVDEFKDTLHCDVLELHFDGSQLSVVDPTDPTTHRQMTIERIIARGQPAVIAAHSRQTRIAGEQLEYDIIANRVRAVSRQQPVAVTNSDHRFQARSLDYQIPPDQSLGNLDAQGPGVMTRFSSADQEEFHAEWSNLLTIRPDADKKMVTLDGETLIQLGTETRVSAQHMRIWLWEIETRNPQQQVSREFLPAQLAMKGDVEIMSPRLHGTATTLSAFWPEPVQPIGAIHRPGVQHFVVRRPFYPDQESGIQFFPPIDPSNRVQQAQFLQDADVAATDPSNLKPKRKFKFHGQTVVVHLSDHTRDATIRELKVRDDVSIREILGPADTKTPLSISGRELQMTPQGDRSYRVFVQGTNDHLANFRANGLQLVGENIHLDQAANRLWVQGPGKMQILPNRPARTPSPTDARADVSQPDVVNVAWSGGMVFDGLKVYFEHQVQMTAGQEKRVAGHPQQTTKETIDSQSAGLSVTLTQPLDFQNINSRNRPNNAEIKEIVLVDRVDQLKSIFQLAGHTSPQPVVIENRTFDDTGQLAEQQKIVAASVSYFANTGQVLAAGPGSISHHQTGRSGFTMGNAAGNTSSKGNQLTFTRVNFDQSVQANSRTEQVVIRGNTRVINLPVRSWEISLDPDSVHQVPAGGVKMVCDEIALHRWTPRGSDQPNDELQATGNTHVWGDLFEATADRVSYERRKDMLVIEGTPRSPANLWYQKTPQAARDKLVAGKIEYRPSDQFTRVSKIKSAGTKFNQPLFGGSR